MYFEHLDSLLLGLLLLFNAIDYLYDSILFIMNHDSLLYSITVYIGTSWLTSTIENIVIMSVGVETTKHVLDHNHPIFSISMVSSFYTVCR